LIEEFVKQSNLIDTQKDEFGRLIPGENPGDLLYDNHVDAINTGIEILSKKEVNLSLCKEVHRSLTKNIWYFESQDMSGQYRDRGIRIGSEIPPKHYLVRKYIEEIWIPAAFKLVKEGGNFQDIMDLHYAYECIHPWIDCNGRSGRCLLYSMCVVMNIPPKIIYYEKRFEYYDKIREYRREKFNKFIIL
jgi:Fic family protein